ncbi:type IX secretion system membrane protein PorP/SprF [Bacteroidales bacterium AH-315-I05]|nr:type IX secretion system membrane protein PorP/SprF [Bacteroidales bacterium AH-315-I05]
MKKLLYISSLLFSALAFGQQIGQHTQYLHNSLMLNPATTGTDNLMNITLSYRNQWTGMNQAPQTYYLSIHSPINKAGIKGFKPASIRGSQPGFLYGNRSVKPAIGGYLLADTYGPFTKISAYFTDAVQFPITSEIQISAGTAFGVSFLQMDESKLSLTNPNDNTYNGFISQNPSRTYLDLNAGIWLFAPKFYFGYSGMQFLQNKIYFGDVPLEGKLNTHHFITGGYRFKLQNDLSIITGALVKYMYPAPISFDINVTVNYNESIWAGIYYRNQESIILMLGYEFNKMMMLSYSYDITTGHLSSYNSGSHEIVISVKLKTSKNKAPAIKFF